jgi:tetratricopeptide (TPR) repeat protein
MAKNKKTYQPVIETALPSKSFQINPYLVLSLLGVLVFISYSLVWDNGLVWDDEIYILLNDNVKDFNLKGIFTEFAAGNYHPLTMLSLAIDYAIAGKSPAIYHFTNIIFHILNSWLVFIIFQKLRQSFNVSILSALLFAIHPLHVESVAWAAERKDVLYTFFLLLSLINYLKFDDSNSKKYYIYSILFFLASCLSKGMAVVLPALLIITDLWMLKKPLKPALLLNKIPYFVLTLIFAYIATTAQKDAGADASQVISDAYTIFERIQMVAFAFLFYWVKTFFPINLLPFYPYPTKIDGAMPSVYASALIGIVIFTALVWWFGRKNPKVLWATAFFLIAVSTVLQVFPVGSAVVADRYYYLSSIGPLFLVASVLARFIDKSSVGYIVSGLAIVILSVMSFFQVGHWKNGFTLFKPAEKFYPASPMVLSNIGWYYLAQKDFVTTKQYLLAADGNNFQNADVCRTIGSILIDEGDYKGALEYLRKSEQYLPKSNRLYWLMSLAYYKSNNFDNAMKFNLIATKNDPDNAEYLITQGSILMGQKKYEAARAVFDSIIKKDSKNWDAHLNRALSFGLEGDAAREVRELEALIAKNPQFMPAYKNIGISFINTGSDSKAIDFWQRAAVYDTTGDFEYNIGVNYALRNDALLAKEWHTKAARKGKKEAIEALKVKQP